MTTHTKVIQGWPAIAEKGAKMGDLEVTVGIHGSKIETIEKNIVDIKKDVSGMWKLLFGILVAVLVQLLHAFLTAKH